MKPLHPTLVALGLAACATGGGAHPVEQVTLHGNQAFDSDEIIDRLATRPPHGWGVKTREEFDPVALDVDADRIETWYRERGYFDAKVTSVRSTERPGGGAQIDIDLVEGEVTLLTSVSFEGADELLAKQALEERDLTPVLGKPFLEARYERAKAALASAFQHRGYAYAKATGVVEVDRALHQANLRFKLALGPPTTFGETTVEGLDQIGESTVRSRLAWKEGDPFDPDLLEKTEGLLFSLGVFSSVRASFKHREENPVAAMTVHLAEGTRHEVRLGFGAALDSTHYEVHGRAGYTIHGVLDQPLLTFRADATPGWSWQRGAPFESGPSAALVASFERDDLFVPRLHGQLLGAFDRQPRVGYTLTGPRTSLGVTWPFAGDELKLYAGWQLQYQIFESYDPLVFGGESTSDWLGYYSQQLVYDTRDLPLDAHRGVYAALEVLEGGPPAAGRVGFLRVTPEVRGYLPLGHRLVLAARVRYGTLLTGGVDDAPLPVRYLGGGANDHRGFGFQRLSPSRLDSTGARIPVGGTTDVLGSVEVRCELFTVAGQWLVVAAFGDAGDVTGPGRPGAIAGAGLDLRSLHYAAGLGLRYSTVVGPIRADVGYRLNRYDAAGADGLANPDPGSRLAFHLSLGEAF